MKFTAFKEVKLIRNVDSLAGYLEIELRKAFRDLQIGLTRLSFIDNFDSFETTIVIPASSEVAIQNKLLGGAIPTQRIIVRSNSHEIVDGDTTWNNQFVYLKNTGAADATLTVIFLRSNS